MDSVHLLAAFLAIYSEVALGKRSVSVAHEDQICSYVEI